jgi:hypothetical protein
MMDVDILVLLALISTHLVAFWIGWVLRESHQHDGRGTATLPTGK